MTLRICMLAIAMSATLAYGESMRCGKWVVAEDVTPEELVAKCGAPASKESKVTDVRRANANGGTFVVGTSTTERWLYDRGTRAFRMVVTLVDGKIKSIDRAE